VIFTTPHQLIAENNNMADGEATFHFEPAERVKSFAPTVWHGVSFYSFSSSFLLFSSFSSFSFSSLSSLSSSYFSFYSFSSRPLFLFTTTPLHCKEQYGRWRGNFSL